MEDTTNSIAKTLERNPVGADEILAAARLLLAAGRPELATLSVMHSYGVESRVKGRAALAAECVRAVPGRMLRAVCRLAFVCALIDGFGAAFIILALSTLVDFIEGFSPSESYISTALDHLGYVMVPIVLAADVVAVLWLGQRIRAKDVALGDGIPRLVAHLVIGVVAVAVQWVYHFLDLGGKANSAALIPSTFLMASTMCVCSLTNSRANEYSGVGMICSVLAYGAILIGTKATRDPAYIALFAMLVCVWFIANRTFRRLPLIERVMSGDLDEPTRNIRIVVR